MAHITACEVNKIINKQDLDCFATVVFKLIIVL